MPPKIGTLQIYVAEGRNLPNRDFFGKQDPFLEFTLGNISKRTRVDKKGGCNPKWKEDVFLDVPQGVQNLAMKCCDRDVSSNDDIGSSSIDLFRIFEEEEVHSWYKMQRKGKFAGEIYLEFTYTPTVSNPLRRHA
ncbi:C2 domain-containing protein [Dimargaris cristalligena]|uniref:C2 domain-containing protein n=1 Tax=Dimargaris cristalligena TaxID=215637 RepID=A0A4P9ZRF8_9FUNG|nr:C2 domain-containing protein [Dimargaris cristalligena]|eukprot:RKP36033.1 C2 domain-containing protein [Dimargaris cristalligena]